MSDSDSSADNETLCFYEVHIPRENPRAAVMPSTEYSQLVRRVFAAVDDLVGKRLINSYHFLTHAELDLRLSVPKESDVTTVGGVLSSHGLPSELHPWNPPKNDTLVEIEGLYQATERVRLLLGHSNPSRGHEQQAHYENNALGLGNSDEVKFHARQAFGWELEVICRGRGYVQEQVTPEQLASARADALSAVRAVLDEIARTTRTILSLSTVGEDQINALSNDSVVWTVEREVEAKITSTLRFAQPTGAVQ
jgi:hypothetical protein